MKTIRETERQFLNLLKEQSFYREALSLIQWDLRTKIPNKAVNQRSEVIGFLSQKVYHLSTSDRMKHFVNTLNGKTTDQIIQKAILECKEEYERNSKIPDDEFRDYVTLQSKSESVWQEAREKDDFSLLQPYLEKLVKYNKKFANYWGYEKNIYDALLHIYEPGVTTELLDEVFPKLRKSLTQLLEKITNSYYQPDPSILQHRFPKANQEQFTTEILKRIGFDFNAGRLDTTIHPFAIAINENDVRITTRYDEQDFRMAVFGTIHEGGHALYEQNINDKLAQTPLHSGTSMGIHESQSLFWENFIGRSKAFWQSNYDLFKYYAPNDFADIPFTDFCHAVNEVKASLIRIEADELTYCLHIMIRYELEKALINGEIEVKDLPELWNKKMKAYLNIQPKTDREGVLQDIHWAAGNFGYFPSYALGYIYAAQFKHTIAQEMDIYRHISNGNYTPIKEWLGKHIHQHGKTKKPLQILRDATNESLNPNYLVKYLTEKYSEIYNIN